MPADRAEKATPHRREKARKDGDLLHSRELTAAAGVLAGVLALGFLGQRFLESFRSSFGVALELAGPDRWEPSTLEATVRAIRSLATGALVPPGIIISAIFAASALSGILQTGGPKIQGGSIAFRLERISPASNLRNLFSLRAASRLGKSLIPALFLGVFAVHRIAHELTVPPFSVSRLEILAADVYGLLLTAAWLLLAWALVDYVVEWRSRESRLMMSREEMKQEFKETEGGPQTRSRIRGLQRQMRRRKVKADVANAAVVLTNPTHYAVALSFDFKKMDAPRLVAKGRNLLAEEIKAEARWGGIPIVENPPLARSLYRSVEVGHAIPVELYAAIATILAYLYRQRVEAEMRERHARQTAAHSRTTTVTNRPSAFPFADGRRNRTRSQSNPFLNGHPQ